MEGCRRDYYQFFGPDRIKNCKEVVAEMIAAFRKKKSQHIENIYFAQLFGFLSRQPG